MNKSTVSIIGFILFIVGAVAIILTLVGLNLSILKPIDALGPGTSFLLKIFMTIFGIIIVYLSRLDKEWLIDMSKSYPNTKISMVKTIRHSEIYTYGPNQSRNQNI